MKSEEEIRLKMKLLKEQFESADYWAESQYEILEWVLDERPDMFPRIE